MTLRGRGILITGASQGFGKAVAYRCVQEGADVLLCARSARDLERTCEELHVLACPGQRVSSMIADVSDPHVAPELVAKAGERLGRFTGLVNNAGIYGPKGLIEETDWAEWVKALEINLLGTVMMCRAALPVFRREKYGKIVNLSGGGATAPMPRMSAYATSKAAVVRFTETIAGEAAASGIDINAVAPGALNTRLLDEILAAGPEKVGEEFYRKSIMQREQGGAPLDKGAQLCSYLLSAESDGITGKLISAIWDPWPTLATRAEQLRASDIYTLRRIVPRDRGVDWGEE